MSEQDRDPPPPPAAPAPAAPPRADVDEAAETSEFPIVTAGAESAANQRIQELTTDIGAVLHANTAILLMGTQALDVGIRALAPNPFPANRAPTNEDIDAALAGPATAASRAIEKVVAVLAEPERAATVPEVEALREELTDHASTLADFVNAIPIEESRPSVLRTVACRIEEIVDGLPQQALPKEVVRHLRQAAHEVERITALATLLQARAGILQMDYTIRSFREFVTTNLRPREPARRLRVAKLLESAYRQLADYAHSSNVMLRRKFDAPGAEIVGIKRDLVRALANLLHNAIKYSWRRERSDPAWVEVRVYRQDHNVCIAFENWGVPISSVEIQDGLIFKLGYRGKLATDRGRLGTGVGLTDARDVAEKHKGKLLVESRPARAWGPDDPASEEYYRQPFLTTVTLCLPEAV